MLVQVEMARSAVGPRRRGRTPTPDADPVVLAEAALVAKTWCSDAYRVVSAEAVQLHGGIGFTWEHDAHLYFRRARADAALLGPSPPPARNSPPPGLVAPPHLHFTGPVPHFTAQDPASLAGSGR